MAIKINLAEQIRLHGLPEPVREYRFHPVRRWRFDLCWPGQMLAVEREGGTWVQGRHSRGKGYERDCEKYNAALLLGWRVLRFTSGQIGSGYALQIIQEALAS